jgi:hypothetical protein
VSHFFVRAGNRWIAGSSPAMTMRVDHISPLARAWSRAITAQSCSLALGAVTSAR